MTEDVLSHFLQHSIPYLERVGKAGALPYMWRFPCGSCEPTSAILAGALELRFPQSSVQVAKGVSQTGRGQHFWVEIDGYALDATAHQFEEFVSPLFSKAPSPVEEIFAVTERTSPSEALEALKEVNISPDVLRGMSAELLREVERAF